MEKFAQDKGIHNNSLWSVEGDRDIGLAGAAAFLAGQQWKDFDSLFVDAGHFVFIAPSAGNHHPMHFMKIYFTGLALSISIFRILSRLVILLLLKPITSIPLPKPRRLTGGGKKIKPDFGLHAQAGKFV